MNTKFDVIIVGAGLVGEAIACALAQGSSDIQIALIDPAANKSAPKDGRSISDYDMRVSALTAKTQAFLTRLGAWQKIPAERLSAYTKMQVWDGEGTGSVTFDANDLHVPALGHIVENNQTQYALQQCVRDHSNITLLAEKVRYIDNRNADGLTPVMLENGEQLFAQLVVGADGAQSRVRQWIGVPTTEWDYGHHAIVATVRTEKPLQKTAWQRFRPEGPLAFLPMPHDPCLASIVWSTSPAEAEAVLALSDSEFNQALSAAFEYKLGAIVETSAKASIPLRQRHARTYWSEGVVLAGDAAHTIHPLAGQGVNLGFKDAEALSDEILRGFNKGLDIGSEAVLARYQRRRQADNLATMAAMEGFKQLFAADQPLLRLLRNEGMRLFDKFLPVKQHVMMRAMGLE